MNLNSTIIDTKLTNNLKNSFVNDYMFWKNIINTTNNAISINKNENTLNLLYTYDEFCKKFINNIENMKHGEIFSQDTIQNILLKMIHEKI